MNVTQMSDNKTIKMYPTDLNIPSLIDCTMKIKLQIPNVCDIILDGMIEVKSIKYHN